MLLLLIVSHVVYAQENITIVTPSTEVAEGLDLYAVAEIFKDSENLEEFEQALNDPELGINNLDLDRDGYVDYIRVVEQVNDHTHVIILQVPLGEDEFQDVATIEIEKTGYDNYNMQVRGNEVIYGVDYYVAPAYVHIHRWPIITWIYRPFYRPYRSVFYFGYYPHWWHRYHPVTVHVYHSHTARYSRRANFHVTRVNRVTTVHEVNYKSRNSPRVEKNVKNSHPSPGPDRIKRTTTPQPERRKATMKRDGDEAYKNRNNRTSNSEVRRSTKPTVKNNTPVRSDARKIIKPKVKRSTPVYREVKKTTKPKVKRSTSIKSDSRKITKSKVKRSTPVKSDSRKITKPKAKRSTPVKSEVKKPSKPKVKKSTTVKNGVRRTSKPKVEKKTTVKKNNKNRTAKKKSN